MNASNQKAAGNTFKTAVVQFNIVNGAVHDNLKKITGYIEQLKKEEVSLAVFPEMVSCGFDNENLSEHSRTSGIILENWRDLSLKYQMAIAGSIPEAIDGHIFNTMYFVDVDGHIKGYYRKIHLFKPTLEHLFFKAASDITVIDTCLGRIGLAICYDLRFPELFRMLVEKGAQIILICAQWPETRIGHWKILVQARAIENQLYMVCANRTGTDGTLVFPGGSMIVDPAGVIVADAGTREGAAHGLIDLNVLTAFRKNLPFLDDRRLDVYGVC